jgi:YD repeat-containing protein
MKRVVLAAVLVLGAQVLTLAQSQHPGYDDIGDLEFWADLNRDGYADFNDVANLAASWLEQDCGLLKACDRADVSPRCGNGAVDFYDFSRVAEQWRLCTDVGDSNCSHVPLTLKEPPSRLVSFVHPASCENRCSSGKLSTVPANPAHGVYLFSGEFHKSVVDLQIPGRGFDFIWARTYRSRTGLNTRIGNGWDYSYNIKVQPCGADLIVYGGDARRDVYYQQPDGTWIAEGFFRVMTQNLDLSFTLTFGDNGSWTFHSLDDSNSAGQITSITDRNGNSMVFDYDVSGRLITIKDTLERNITLSYNGDGFIDGVTDFNDRTVSYQYYDGIEPNGLLGDLKSVTTPAVTGTPTGNDFPSGKTTLYTYSTGFADDRLNHNLLTITDPNGRTFLQNTYSDDVNDPNFDHVVRQVLGNPSDIIDLTYVRQTPDASNNYTVTRTVSNDCVGNVGEHSFDNRNQLVIERSYTGRADPNAPTYLDPDKNAPAGKLRAGDPDYFETRYQYNNQYLCTRIDYPKGNYVTNVHEVDLDPGASQRFAGNLRERHQFAGALEPISDQNEIIELFEYDTGLGGCGCGATNFVTRYVDPNGNETLHEYDPNGNRIKTTYPTLPSEPNIVEEWRYNDFGQTTQNLLPNDGCTPQRWDEFTYYTGLDGHQNGYLKSVIGDVNNLAVTITFTYDAVGNILTETDPNEDTTSYSVNQLNQIVMETSPAPFNYQTKYFYDDCDNEIRVERPFGGGTALTRYEYDILGQMTRMEQDVGDGNTVTTQYEYDGNGNLIRVTDGRGDITQTTYDERDLVYQVTRGYGSPNASTSTRHYDKNSNFEKLYDGNGNLVYDKEYDGFERVVEVADPCGSTESYTYDAAGNNTGFTDKNGYTTDYEYDGLNRLISLTDPCGSAEGYTYDAIGNDTSFTDKNGNTTTYQYDALNRLVSLIDPCGCSEGYRKQDKLYRQEWAHNRLRI